MSLIGLVGCGVVNWHYGTSQLGLYLMGLFLLVAGLGFTGRRGLWVDAENKRLSIVNYTLFRVPWSRINYDFGDFDAIVLETKIDDTILRKQGTKKRAWYHEVELVGKDRRAYLSQFGELGQAVGFCEKLARLTDLEFKEKVRK